VTLWVAACWWAWGYRAQRLRLTKGSRAQVAPNPRWCRRRWRPGRSARRRTCSGSRRTDSVTRSVLQRCSTAAGRLPGRPARPPGGRPADRHRRRHPQPPQHRPAAAYPEPTAAVPAGRPQHRPGGQVTSRGGPGGDLASPDRRPPVRPHRPRPPAHPHRRRRRHPPTQPVLPRQGTHTGRPINPHS
jgi:hypothetical protein